MYFYTRIFVWSCIVNQAAKRILWYYVIGFVLSLVLSVAAYLLVKQQLGHGTPLLIMVSILAVTQLVVQLVCFFHLGREPKPYLNTTSFLFMILVVGTIGIGSIWIMHNLNYRMMPMEVETHIQDEENIRMEHGGHEH